MLATCLRIPYSRYVVLHECIPRRSEVAFFDALQWDLDSPRSAVWEAILSWWLGQVSRKVDCNTAMAPSIIMQPQPPIISA
jgi:hypothetical protein